MKLSVVDVCPCPGALASAGSAYFVDVDPSSDRVAEVKERLARHPFLRANMGAAAAGRDMASSENQHLFCKAGGGGEVVEVKYCFSVFLRNSKIKIIIISSSSSKNNNT